MGDTFAVMRTLETTAPASAVIVGGGYIGLEMADALTVRGLAVTQMEQLERCCPPSTRSWARWSMPNSARHGSRSWPAPRPADHPANPARQAGCQVQATAARRQPVTRLVDMVLVVVGIRPDTALAADAGATLGVKGAIAVDTRMRTNLPDVCAAGGLCRHPTIGCSATPICR
jgi:pyruvate/2-oxoglutarate dehydrogenase complex dihydrolipoamide dehydrogenase (E3) component